MEIGHIKPVSCILELDPWIISRSIWNPYHMEMFRIHQECNGESMAWLGLDFPLPIYPSVEMWIFIVIYNRYSHFDWWMEGIPKIRGIRIFLCLGQPQRELCSPLQQGCSHPAHWIWGNAMNGVPICSYVNLNTLNIHFWLVSVILISTSDWSVLS